DYSSRRHRWRDYAAERETRERDSRVSPQRGLTQATNTAKAAPGWSGTCEELSAVLRNWPVREIERDVRLSDAQRVAFYELVTASLKAADTLSSACPAEAALTPVGRMDAIRKRLAALRAAHAARGGAARHRRDPPGARAFLRGARPGAEGALCGHELRGIDQPHSL